MASSWESSSAVQQFIAASDVESKKPAGPVYVMMGDRDFMISTFLPLWYKLYGLGTDLEGVLLAGQDHTQALWAGWPYAKAFLEENLPPR